uniref:Uncharacterized protein n=1 Tax=Anguilla anguilla TaxID=7936 RepID=A0A0E9REC8_ANGAN
MSFSTHFLYPHFLCCSPQIVILDKTSHSLMLFRYRASLSPLCPLTVLIAVYRKSNTYSTDSRRKSYRSNPGWDRILLSEPCILLHT